MAKSHRSESPVEEASVNSEAERILVSIRDLRRNIVDAWQARGVILTRDEQRALRREIRDTCEMLTDLTSGE